MTGEIVERVRRSSRYRNVDPTLVERFAAEEMRKARNADDAVKRVKRRLHQAVGAFRSDRSASSDWPVHDPVALRDACVAAMRRHASTRERLPHLDRFSAGIWEYTGVPASVIDLGCGLHPLALPWMGIGDARYVAVDADAGTLTAAAGFLEAIGQPHRVEALDLVRASPDEDVEVALLLKLVTTPRSPGARCCHAPAAKPARPARGRQLCRAIARRARRPGRDLSRAARAPGRRVRPRPLGGGGIGPERARLRPRAGARRWLSRSPRAVGCWPSRPSCPTRHAPACAG